MSIFSDKPSATTAAENVVNQANGLSGNPPPTQPAPNQANGSSGNPPPTQPAPAMDTSDPFVRKK